MKNISIRRLKLLCLILFTTVIIFIKDLRILISLLVLLLMLTSFWKSESKLSGRIYPLLLIGLFVILFQLIFNTSIDVLTRLTNGLSAAIKIITLSLSVFLYTLFTSPNEIILVFSFLPKSIQLMLTITFSMIPAIIEESHKITLVQNSRGYNTRFLHLLNNFLPVIIPLLHRTLRRAEQIAMVMQARGYDEA